NGLVIPSDNPELKNINLEIFKTSIIEYIALDKVYHPRLSGDFGGANINIVSKEHIGRPYLKLGIGSAVNLQTFDKGNFKLQDGGPRSEEHTSELQSRENLVCRLLLEKRN